MSSGVTTLILVIITISLAVVIVGYYSSLSAITSNSITPLQTAVELSKEIYISYSPPVISYIIPTEPNIPLNLSVRSLVTLNLNFSGPLYVVPFLMKTNYVPYNYIPEGYYGGYINQISNPDYIGYVSVSGSGVIKEVTFQNTQVDLLTRSIAGISFYAFEVKPNSVLNVSFTTNASYVPVLWILANISGKMFRIAYPVIEAQQYVNTYSGNIKYVLPLGLNSSAPLYMAGWFDVVPNNGSTTVINALLTNQTYQVDISLNVKPVTPTEYNVTLYVNNTLVGYSSSNQLLSANNKYMYVIEGYVSGSKTYLELTIYSTSASTPVVTIDLQIPLPLNTGAIVEIGPETNYQFIIYSGTSSLTNLMLANGPYVNITNQLSNNLPNGVSHLYYYYLIAPPVDSQFVLVPTYYYPNNGNVPYLEVTGNSLV
jgi:hypothetical protein